MEDLVLFSIFLPLEDYLQRIKSLESFRTIRTVHGFFQERTVNDRDQNCYHYVTGVSPDITCFPNSTIFKLRTPVTVSFSSPLQFTGLFPQLNS